MVKSEGWQPTGGGAKGSPHRFPGETNQDALTRLAGERDAALADADRVRDLREGVEALASMVLGSPRGTRYVIEQLPGLAHAIDRVTRFADPPVDVYTHRPNKET